MAFPALTNDSVSLPKGFGPPRTLKVPFHAVIGGCEDTDHKCDELNEQVRPAGASEELTYCISSCPAVQHLHLQQGWMQKDLILVCADLSKSKVGKSGRCRDDGHTGVRFEPSLKHSPFLVLPTKLGPRRRAGSKSAGWRGASRL